MKKKPLSQIKWVSLQDEELTYDDFIEDDIAITDEYCEKLAIKLGITREELTSYDFSENAPIIPNEYFEEIAIDIFENYAQSITKTLTELTSEEWHSMAKATLASYLRKLRSTQKKLVSSEDGELLAIDLIWGKAETNKKRADSKKIAQIKKDVQAHVSLKYKNGVYQDNRDVMYDLVCIWPDPAPRTLWKYAKEVLPTNFKIITGRRPK